MGQQWVKTGYNFCTPALTRPCIPQEIKLVLGSIIHLNLLNMVCFKSIISVTYTYTHCIIPYCGRPNEEASAFYVKGVKETVKYLVQQLQSYVNLQGRNISFDGLYTSVSLAEWLLSHNITCVGREEPLC